MAANAVERIEGQPANRFTRFGDRLPWWTPQGLFVPHLYRPGLYSEPDVYKLPREQSIKLGLTSPRIENPFDLRNLRVFDSEEVVKTFQNFVENHQVGKKSFVAIAFGGTIASTLTEEGGTPKLGIDTIIETAGENINSRYNHSSLQFPTPIMSSQMHADYIADAVIAMSWMYQNMSDEVREEFMGFLVSQGTDTMSPVATHAAMMLGPNLDFSVGVTGAQLALIP